MKAYWGSGVIAPRITDLGTCTCFVLHSIRIRLTAFDLRESVLVIATGSSVLMWIFILEVRKFFFFAAVYRVVVLITFYCNFENGSPAEDFQCWYLDTI